MTMLPLEPPLRWVWCPACGAPAAVKEEWAENAAPLPVMLVKASCNTGHRYNGARADEFTEMD